MAASEAWLTAAELAGLPGMPGSEFRTRGKLDKLGVPSRIRAGTKGGGGREFNAAYLPPETRAALLLQALEAKPDPVPSSTQVSLPNCAISQVAPSGPRQASRQEAACADARAVLLRQLDALVPLCGGITKAAHQMVEQVKAGVASPELLAAAEAANQRTRKGATEGVPLSVRTLFDWQRAFKLGGWNGLLPEPTRTQPLAAIGDDVAAVLRRYASAVGSSRNLTHVAQAITLEFGRPFDEWRSLYDRARRALPKVDKAKLIKARHTGAERAAKLPFKRRDASVFRPLDIGVCDGHSFKAKVRHPDHGQPFTPEVTLVMDACTRKVTGWSVSLSESTIAVGDAQRHSVATHGIYAVMYTDNGSGQKAKRLDCDVVGLYARLGTHHETGRPAHPQGHGVIERSWQTHMIKCARQFATYSGSDGDDGSYKAAARTLRKEQTALKKAQGSGQVVQLSAKCPSWRQFIDAVERAIVEYNATHRHRGLPKHEDGPHAGLHLTPDEAWAAFLVPEDVQHLDAIALRNVFMPAVLATAIRGEVRFLNQTYFSGDLVQVEGQRVRVHYDIHDPAKVWVWGLDGRFVCEAIFGANRIDYFPRAVVDMARERRVMASIKRREAQIETARQELTRTLEAPVDVPAFEIPTHHNQRDLQVLERVDGPLQGALSAAPAADARPFFDSAADRYEWLMQHRSAWTPEDQAWASLYTAGPDYEALRDYYASRGLEWASDQADDDSSFNQAG